MDKDRMLKVHQARNAQLEAMNTGLPEAQKGQVEELKARFKDVAGRMAKYVEHNHYPLNCFPETKTQQHRSGARYIGAFEGLMPDVYMSFSYDYKHPDFVSHADLGGTGFNEFKENITTLRVQFSHYPEGLTSGPTPGDSYLPSNMQYGEVFASEAVSFNDLTMLEHDDWDAEVAETFWGQHPSVVLTLIEQAVDQYEAAQASPYELRVGLVQV